MPDIWDRVNEAIDTDPLKLRAIVAELLARAEHAEEGARLSSDRLGEVRADLAESERVRAKLGQTIAAFPDARNAANLAHARAERDRLRARLTGVGIHANRIANCIWPETPAWVALADLRNALDGDQ